MGRIRQNYFFGIKTPWTLANEEVWRKTHRFTGYVWVAAGFVGLLTYIRGALSEGLLKRIN